MKRQFTATAYILEEEKVLLIYHRKLKKWLPPGGHIHPNETPPEAVKREAKEETGLDIAILKQENLWIEKWNASSFERPFMCLLEEIPEHKGEPQHQHIDMIYLAYPIGGKIEENIEETAGIRWFTQKEVEELEPDVEIFVETIETLRTIFSSIDQYFTLKGA